MKDIEGSYREVKGSKLWGVGFKVRIDYEYKEGEDADCSVSWYEKRMVYNDAYKEGEEYTTVGKYQELFEGEAAKDESEQTLTYKSWTGRARGCGRHQVDIEDHPAVYVSKKNWVHEIRFRVVVKSGCSSCATQSKELWFRTRSSLRDGAGDTDPNATFVLEMDDKLQAREKLKFAAEAVAGAVGLAK